MELNPARIDKSISQGAFYCIFDPIPEESNGLLASKAMVLRVHITQHTLPTLSSPSSCTPGLKKEWCAIPELGQARNSKLVGFMLKRYFHFKFGHLSERCEKVCVQFRRAINGKLIIMRDVS